MLSALLLGMSASAWTAAAPAWSLGGSLLDLPLGKASFFAASMPAHTPTTAGSVILIADFGGHPGSPGVQASLFQFLPQQGWAVLSIDPPDLVLAAAPSPGDWQQAASQLKVRTDAALQWLAAHQMHNTVLIAQGRAGVALLLAYPGAWPDGVRGIALLAPPRMLAESNPLPATIARLTLPIDLVYAHADLPDSEACQACVDSASEHRIALRRLFLPARDVQFSDVSITLGWALLDWMKALAGVQIAHP